MIELVLIAAVGDNGVIGRDNAMPWRLPSDLRRFRERTMGRPVIMGRKTFESLGGPLKGRTNIIVSRDQSYAAPGVLVAADLAYALEAARGEALRRGVNEIVIGGGSHVYAALMPPATRLEITRVHASPEGEIVFPPIDGDTWEETERITPERTANDSAPFTWLTYRRRERVT